MFKSVEQITKERDLAVNTLVRIREMLVEYQRDDRAELFRNSHKCRRLCEEAIAKCRGADGT